MKTILKSIRGLCILCVLFVPPILAGYTGDNLLALSLAFFASIVIPFAGYQVTDYMLGGEI